MSEPGEVIMQGIADLYAWIDSELARHADRAGICGACGRCCDFPAYDHRLYVSSAEMAYFRHKTGPDLRPMTGGRCPYQEAGRCTVHANRFSGCRIFCCQGDAAFQNQLSEQAVQRIKALCRSHGWPYRYMDLAEALNAAAPSRP